MLICAPFRSCLFLPNGKNRRRTVERFKSVKYNFSVRPSSLHELPAGVQQIYNTAQEVNGLAQKNKVSIEGLASEVGSFRFNGEERETLYNFVDTKTATEYLLTKGK